MSAKVFSPDASKMSSDRDWTIWAACSQRSHISWGAVTSGSAAPLCLDLAPSSPTSGTAHNPTPREQKSPVAAPKQVFALRGGRRQNQPQQMLSSLLASPCNPFISVPHRSARRTHIRRPGVAHKQTLQPTVNGGSSHGFFWSSEYESQVGIWEER